VSKVDGPHSQAAADESQLSECCAAGQTSEDGVALVVAAPTSHSSPDKSSDSGAGHVVAVDGN